MWSIIIKGISKEKISNSLSFGPDPTLLVHIFHKMDENPRSVIGEKTDIVVLH